MTDQQTCPHCGASLDYVKKGDILYKCGAVLFKNNKALNRTPACMQRQLNQQATIIEKLKSALHKYGSHRDDCQIVQSGTFADHP